jgi:hypothetical protein
VEGPLQKYEGVIHVQARRIEALVMTVGRLHRTISGSVPVALHVAYL